MSSIKSSLLKKRPRKVTFDGDTFYVRCLTITEQQKVEELAKADGGEAVLVRFALTRGIVEENGDKVFEPDSPDADEIPMETASLLFNEIGRASKVAKIETVEKNLVATP